jgi:glutathione S-transferase
MTSIDFNDSTLFISLRSPFARRVRLALLENSISFLVEIHDVFNLKPAFLNVNPLGRVPALRLKSGQELIDSNIILQVFYENHVSHLIPKGTADRLEVFRWQALGIGLCEKVVEYYLETLKPKQDCDEGIKTELNDIVQRVLSRLEKKLERQSKDSWIIEDVLTQADIDVGSALDYLSLRFSGEWKKQFPLVCDYLGRLNQRSSFRETSPPQIT